MLAIIIFILTTRICSTSTFTWAKNWKQIDFAVCITVVVLTIMFWALHILLSADPENPDKYSKEWKDSKSLSLLSFLYTMLSFGIAFAYVYEITHGKTVSLQEYALPFTLLLVLDVAIPIAIYNTYSFSIKETILDSILFPLSRSRNGLVLLALFIFWDRYFAEIFVAIILTFVVASLISLLKRFFWWVK